MTMSIELFLADAVQYDSEAREEEARVREGRGCAATARRRRELAESCLDSVIQAERRQLALVDKFLQEGCAFEHEAAAFELKAAASTLEGSKFWRDMADWKRGMADDKVRVLLANGYH